MMQSGRRRKNAPTLRYEGSAGSLRPLWKEITVVLVVKLMLLAGLWYLFFSEPVDEHLTARDVSAYMLD